MSWPPLPLNVVRDPYIIEHLYCNCLIGRKADEAATDASQVLSSSDVDRKVDISQHAAHRVTRARPGDFQSNIWAI